MTGETVNKVCPLCGGSLREDVSSIPFLQLLIGQSRRSKTRDICADWPVNSGLTGPISAQSLRSSEYWPVNLQRSVVVVKDVPAEVCGDCGEPFLSGKATDAVAELLGHLQDLKVEVSVVEYPAGRTRTA